MNYIEELYLYFSFLKVPHTSDYPTFYHNYCDNRSTREPVDMGLTLLMSSTDGYRSTLAFSPDELGQVYTGPHPTYNHPVVSTSAPLPTSSAILLPC
jgi:hypothetical protein